MILFSYTLFANNIFGGSAKVNKIWLEYGTIEDGKSGITIHSDLNVNGMKGKRIKIVAFFYDNEKNKLMGGLSGYKTKDGQVCSSKYRTPSYENSHYKDLDIFIPYNAFSFLSGKRNYYVSVRVYDISQSKYITENKIYTAFTGKGKSISIDRNIVQKSNFDDSDREWREDKGYGMFAINKIRNGMRTETIYSRCYACRGSVLCGNCKGLKICTICQGRGGIVTSGYGNYIPCSSCGQTGRCRICKGSGKCVCSSSDYPGYVASMSTLYDSNDRILNTMSYSNHESQSSSSSSVSSSSSNKNNKNNDYIEVIEYAPQYTGNSDYVWCEKCHEIAPRHAHIRKRL